MSFSSKRWQKDLTKLLRSEFKVEMINDDMQEVYVEFHGPKDCPYCGGVWRVRAALPDAYPHKSPSIGFVNKIYHPNIDEMSGAVSLTVIDHVWNPMFDLVKVFEEILPQLILFPNPSDSVNEEATALMMRDKNTYEQRVKEYCKKYAKTEDAGKYAKTEDAGVASNENTSNEEPSVVDSRKRKRESESFSGMLNWLHHVAIHSDDPVIGSIPESSKWRDSGNKEFWVQALLAREALSKRWHSSRNAGEHLQSEQQKKPRMHPTMYEDNVLDHQWTEKRRCSKRTRSVKKPPLCPCCNSRENRKSKDFNDHHHRGRNHPKALKHSVTKIKKIATNMNNRKFFETPPVKEVSVGPSHQANVPEWTGVISESDPKWLGTRMWPPENSNGKLIANITENWNRHSCTCPFPASVECVRFHIAEKRLELNRELGSLFHSWRFDRMGEEVSLSWSKEEEKIFRDLMRSKAPILDKVPKNGLKLLLYKTREKLVSYYFNVYLVQRKSYQNRVTPNRVTPKGVDSDDEAIECGIIGDSFGYKALDVPGLSTSVVCTLNEEDFSALE